MAAVEAPVGCSDQAYLELSESAMIELATTLRAPVPSVDVEIQNSGFAAMTVAFSFQGDDCAPGSVAPNFDWLEVAAVPEPMPAGSSATFAITGSVVGCEGGEFEGALVFSSLEGNAPDARLTVKLSVARPPSAVSVDVIVGTCTEGPLYDDEIGLSDGGGCRTPNGLGVPEASDVVAFDSAPNGACRLFSLDVAAALGGAVLAEPRDVVCYDALSDSYSIVFDGSAEGIPSGVRVDAVSEHPTGDLLLSFDTTVDLGLANPTYDEDIVRFDLVAFTEFFTGSDEGVDRSLDLDALLYRSNDGHLLVSFDVSGSVGGVGFADEDVLVFDPVGHVWNLGVDGSVDETNSLASADVVAVPEPAGLLLIVPGVMLLGLLASGRRRERRGRHSK